MRIRVRAHDEQYTSLNDAAHYRPELAEGPTEVWYVRPQYGRDLRMGLDFVQSERPDLVPNQRNLPATHVLLGEISETNPEKVVQLMQGEVWSPHGEARNLIQNKGLAHTSMSVGDVVRKGNDIYFVDTFGLRRMEASVVTSRVVEANVRDAWDSLVDLVHRIPSGEAVGGALADKLASLLMKVTMALPGSAKQQAMQLARDLAEGVAVHGDDLAVLVDQLAPVLSTRSAGRGRKAVTISVDRLLQMRDEIRDTEELIAQMAGEVQRLLKQGADLPSEGVIMDYGGKGGSVDSEVSEAWQTVSQLERSMTALLDRMKKSRVW